MEASILSENSSAVTDHDQDQDQDQEHDLNHGDKDSNPGIGREEEEDKEEIRGILQAIASTGYFWHDWDKLKSMLSFQLKLVLSEYPEAKMTIDQQNASLGETYQELVTRLDEELHCFIEGPPFTLQRICEILLAARSIYPNLSKLALALEKNLLVTSTLTVCTKPSQQMMPNPEEDKASGEAQPESNSIQNGVETIVRDRDEIMTEVEEADIDEMTIDIDTFRAIIGSSGANSTAAEKS